MLDSDFSLASNPYNESRPFLAYPIPSGNNNQELPRQNNNQHDQFSNSAELLEPTVKDPWNNHNNAPGQLMSESKALQALFWGYDNPNFDPAILFKQGVIPLSFSRENVRQFLLNYSDNRNSSGDSVSGMRGLGEYISTIVNGGAQSYRVYGEGRESQITYTTDVSSNPLARSVAAATESTSDGNAYVPFVTTLQSLVSNIQLILSDPIFIDENPDILNEINLLIPELEVLSNQLTVIQERRNAMFQQGAEASANARNNIIAPANNNGG